LSFVLIKVREFRYISAGAKGVTGSGEDNGRQVLFILKLFKRDPQFLKHGSRECITLLRTIQPDDCDCLASFEEN
jgi:hypothetical protein